MPDFERELKELIVKTLRLEEVRPDEINSCEPLFGGGLNLDSIDALELGVAVRKTYGIKIDNVTAEVRAHFASVRALAAFINSQRGG
jgi:acyl carrier protein